VAFGGCNGSMSVLGSTGLAQTGSVVGERRKREKKRLTLNYNRETIKMLFALPAGCIVYFVTNLQITLFHIALFV
jgi:hypothetical protein